MSGIICGCNIFFKLMLNSVLIIIFVDLGILDCGV